MDVGSVPDCAPEIVRLLPETVRQVLNGCVSSVRTPERGSHITIYVTSTDASGKSIHPSVKINPNQSTSIKDQLEIDYETHV